MHYRMQYLALLSLFSCVPAAGKADETVPSAVDGAVHRLQRLQNVSVRYDQTATYIPPADTTFNYLRGSFVFHSTFRFLDDRAYYGVSADPATRKERPSLSLRTVSVITHERAERMTETPGPIQNFGSIRDSTPIPEDVLIDVALGLRCYGDNRFLAPAVLRKCEVTTEADSKCRFTLVTSEPGRTPHVHSWLVDPHLGYAPTQYTVADRFATGDSVFLEIESSGFKNDHDLAAPTSISVKRFGQEAGRLELRTKYDIGVTQFQLNDPANTPESFSVTWPGKSLVKDERTGAMIRPPTTGPVTDAQIMENRQERQREIDVLAASRGGVRPRVWWWAVSVAFFSLIAILGWRGKKKAAARNG